MENKRIRFIVEVGMFTALGLILDFLAGLYSNFLFPAGGSISFALIPVYIMAFRWGLKGGLITGFLLGALQLSYSTVFGYGLSWIVLVLVILLDYILAYTAIGLAGIYKRKIDRTDMPGKLYYINNGILTSALIRTIIHIVSGWVFFRKYIPESIVNNYIWYYWSIIYNLGYMVPTVILSILIIRPIVKAYHERLLDPDVRMF